jgi:hypothetical protein
MTKLIKKSKSKKRSKKRSKKKSIYIDNENSIKNILDPSYCIKKVQGYDLPVYLKKTKKGTSLFANKDLAKGTIVSYYKVKVYDNYTYKQKINGMYSIDVNGYLGDLYKGSLPNPENNIPFWGYFSNEPSLTQKENIDVKINTSSKDYKSKKPGDTMIFKLVTSKNVKKGDELTWCYGDYYTRDYPTSCALK